MQAYLETVKKTFDDSYDAGADTGEIVDGVEPYMTEAELVIRQKKEEGACRD